ncbi:hypothetical protein [Pseudomonas huanghezhanensis]|uniref:hypothetical protein n=1 Tax=Pseudomonas huanghezhanensis TaxID=3002903 RepID=UPI0022856E03|nr:hypothetical protein [Pseudomonas sp. BSw22131]
MKKPYAFINDHLQTYITLKTRLGGNARFDAINGHIKNDVVIPGQLVIVSDYSKRPPSAEEIELMRLASHVRHQLANDVAGGDGHVIRHYDLLQQVMGYSAIGVGAATGRWDKHLAEVKKTLEDTERLHKLSLVNGTSIARQTFINQRRALFTTLDQQLQGIACWGADLNNSQSIKKMLGTSTKSYLHTGELQGYVKTIGGVARAAHWLKKGTTIGTGLNRLPQCLRSKWHVPPGFPTTLNAPPACAVLHRAAR